MNGNGSNTKNDITDKQLWNYLCGCLERWYLQESDISPYFSEVADGVLPDFEAFCVRKLDAVRFRDRKDLKYALSTFYSAMHASGEPVLFVMKGDGTSTDLHIGMHTRDNGINQGKALDGAIRGFLPGCKFTPIEGMQDSDPLGLKSSSCANAIVGVPSEKLLFDDEKRNGPLDVGLERLADTMGNDPYTLVVLARPVDRGAASTYFRGISQLLDEVHKLTKTTLQESHGSQQSNSTQVGENESTAKQDTRTSGESEGFERSRSFLPRIWKGLSKFIGGSDNSRDVASTSSTTSLSFTTGETVTKGYTRSRTDTTGTTDSTSATVEMMNHQAIYVEETLKLIRDRIKNGLGEGLWETTVIIAGANQAVVDKGSMALCGMWSGKNSHQDPLRIIPMDCYLQEIKTLRPSISNSLRLTNSPWFEEHPLGRPYSRAFTWLTSSELALETNLPHYELPHLASEKMVEYGRYLPGYEKGKQIRLGKLVDHNLETDLPVNLDTDRLNRHLFVTGLTGSGKSTTIRTLLLRMAERGIPFMVIEPAKAEYKELKNKLPELNVFSLSAGTDGLSINPFAFEIPGNADAASALVAHIDRLKAVFNSALGMYSSMPYILEEMIYKSYENAGWDIGDGSNRYLDASARALGISGDAVKSPLRNLFLPTLSEMATLVDDAIKAIFPDKSDYGISLVGALKSRLNSLTRGAKGHLLDVRLSTSMETVLSSPCVIELESFADNDEKAFIMALLLSRIYESRMGKPASTLRHVLVIEEAHRLLSKPPAAGEHSSNSRGKSVEVFSDMLAEVRAYGQGIIVADQIPAKLIPDVLKNTNVKIVHRITAKDDREAVGTAMNLDKEQTADLSRSEPGMATISFDGLNSPIRVKVDIISLGQTEDTGETPPAWSSASDHSRLFCAKDYAPQLDLVDAVDACFLLALHDGAEASVNCLFNGLKGSRTGFQQALFMDQLWGSTTLAVLDCVKAFNAALRKLYLSRQSDGPRVSASGLSSRVNNLFCHLAGVMRCVCQGSACAENIKQFQNIALDLESELGVPGILTETLLQCAVPHWRTDGWSSLPQEVKDDESLGAWLRGNIFIVPDYIGGAAVLPKEHLGALLAAVTRAPQFLCLEPDSLCCRVVRGSLNVHSKSNKYKPQILI